MVLNTLIQQQYYQISKNLFALDVSPGMTGEKSEVSKVRSL